MTYPRVQEVESANVPAVAPLLVGDVIILNGTVPLYCYAGYLRAYESVL